MMLTPSWRPISKLKLPLELGVAILSSNSVETIIVLLGSDVPLISIESAETMASFLGD